MADFLLRLLAVIGVLSILVMAVAIGSGLWVYVKKTAISRNTVLEMNFDKGITELVPEGRIARVVLGKIPEIRTIIEALETAARDPRIQGLVAKTTLAPKSFADIQEIRDAVIRFRRAGKIAIAYAETFGEVSPGNASYYLATAFDEIYLQPSGEVGLTGFISEPRFLKGFLQKISVKPRYGARKEYKNFLNMLNEEKFTDAHREANRRILESLSGQFVQGVSDARKLEILHVKELIDRSPLHASDALQEKLVDGLIYRDEVYEKVKTRLGKRVRFVSLMAYSRRLRRSSSRERSIALIYGVGTIMRGESRYDPFSGNLIMGSESVAAAFRAAIKDRRIRAILFRVTSPGGSYIASDVIWREVLRAREAGKPVIVSMGGVAGSGGYFVSMPADRIIAQPATITGSIGVVGGKMVSRDFWSRFGITFDSEQIGANAALWSGVHDFSADQWEYIQSWLDKIYQDFVCKASKGRNIPESDLEKMARGRIWTGEDAYRLGLVDELGGFQVALENAKRLSGIPEGREVSMKLFPRRKTVFERYFGKDDRSESMLAQVLLSVQPIVKMYRETLLLQESPVLVMQEPAIR